MKIQKNVQTKELIHMNLEILRDKKAQNDYEFRLRIFKMKSHVLCHRDRQIGTTLNNDNHLSID